MPYVTFEQTMDDHSRKILLDGHRDIGLLLFHNWQFLWEPYPVGPVDLKVAAAILDAAKTDPSIKRQKEEYARVIMEKKARDYFASHNIDVDSLNGRDVVSKYMAATI